MYQLQDVSFPAAYIDRKGRPAIEFPNGVIKAGSFSENLAAVRRMGPIAAGKLGYIDRSGTTVIAEDFAFGGPFHEGLAAVVLDGQCYIGERDGSPRMTPPSVRPATSCGGVRSFTTQKCQEGFVDKSGRLAFRFRAPAKFKGKWGYVNRSGQWVIQPRFSRADAFSDGVALTDSGYIDREGNQIAVATEGTAFVQGLAQVALGREEMGYMNHSEKIVFRYHPAICISLLKLENRRLRPPALLTVRTFRNTPFPASIEKSYSRR